jgi:hypothetical protein
MKKYHVHIDAVTASEQSLAYAVDEFGFTDTSFAHLPTDVEHYEPNIHYTLKTDSLAEVRAAMQALRERFSRSPDFEGYLEAEYIQSDVDLSDRETMDFRPVLPFSTRKRSLERGAFRQSEVHATLLTPDFHCPVADGLRAMGFFTALMQKPYGLAQVFTLQGSLRQISEVYSSTYDYLERCGGYTNASIKEERIIDWWLSDLGVRLPPVLEHVEYDIPVEDKAVYHF